MAAPSLQIHVYDNGNLVLSTDVSAPLELGRQRRGEGEPIAWSRLEETGTSRLVIAGFNDTSVSRRHLLLTPVEGRLHVANVSRSLPVVFDDGAELAVGGETELVPPRALSFGGVTLFVEGPETDSGYESLTTQTVAPGQKTLASPPIRQLRELSEAGAVDVESVARWLQTALGALESAATSGEFYSQAAMAVVQVAGLDAGRVLLKDGDGWRPVAAHPAHADSTSDWRPSQRVLRNVCEQRRTLWEIPRAMGETMASLAEVEAVVAAPIMNARGEVVGVLYGDRRTTAGKDPSTRISKVDAMLVELLAWGVAGGLARQEKEREAMAARVRFEQFFTSELTAELEADPDLLQGKDVEVSILVVDISGFSRICERLGPPATLEWIRDTLNALSSCVLDRQGVVVDYVGDSLLAMWGAPKEQPDHAVLASRAALDMLEALPTLNERWETKLGEPLAISIGINSGVARVGNVGSDRKFKYGALGNTVNLASRVQGATKYLRSNLIVTAATRSRLTDDFSPRRLCSVRVVNIAEPVELFAIRPGDEGGTEVHQAYEKALAEFEKGDFREAAQRLGSSLARQADDGPSLVLMSRIVDGLIRGADEHHPVWELPGK